jgi:hypothetical protein
MSLSDILSNVKFLSKTQINCSNLLEKVVNLQIG